MTKSKTKLLMYLTLSLLLIMSSQSVFANEHDVSIEGTVDNSILEELPKDHWVYESIEELYAKGVIDRDLKKIADSNDLTRYEIGLLLSNPFVNFLQSEQEKPEEEIKLFGKIATEFQHSFLTLGFPQETIEQLGELLAELEQPEQDTTQDTADTGDDITYVTVTREQLKETQTVLKDKGYYEGVIDGLYGPLTQRAVKEFQEDYTLGVTGIVDGKLHENVMALSDGEFDFAEKETEKTPEKPEVEETQKQQKRTEITGYTNINYHEVETDGNVPEDGDGNPEYEEKSVFEQVLGIDIIGHISDTVKLVASLGAKNNDGLLNEGANLSVNDVRIVGMQDEINKIVIGQQPNTSLGKLSYRSEGENGLSWLHNGEEFNFFGFMTTKDTSVDEEGNDQPLPYRRNTIGARVASEELIEDLTLGLNLINTRDGSENNSFTLEMPTRKNLTVGSFTTEGEFEGFDIDTEIAVMHGDRDIENSETENETAFAYYVSVGREIVEGLSARLNIINVDENYDVEELVDNEDYAGMESPYTPGEKGGDFTVSYERDKISGDLTVEHWDGETENAKTDKGVRGRLGYKADNYGVNYRGEEWEDYNDGETYSHHSLSGHYEHEFTTTETNEDGEEYERTLGNVRVSDRISVEEKENEPKVATNHFSINSNWNITEDLSARTTADHRVNDHPEEPIEYTSLSGTLNYQKDINDELTINPSYNIRYDHGWEDNPTVEEYSPYEVASTIHSLGLGIEYELIEDTLYFVADGSLDKFDVEEGILDEDGHYLDGSEPRTGVTGQAGINWIAQEDTLFEGLEVLATAGKAVYQYDETAASEDQDSTLTNVEVNYARDFNEKYGVSAHYNDSRTIDEVEEFETQNVSYGVQANANIGENTSLNAGVNRNENTNNMQNTDIQETETMVELVSSPVGSNGPSFNIQLKDIDSVNNNDPSEDYNAREIRATVGGNF